MRRYSAITLLVVILTVVALSGGQKVRASSTLIAEEAELSARCSDRDRECDDLLDGNERTVMYFYFGAELTFTSKQPIKSIYLRFEGEYDWFITLPDGRKIFPGEENYIHKYIALDTAVKTFRLTMPEDSFLTDVFAFGDGTLPDWVQIWQPPCERADLLVLPTHADDEYLWFGGAIPYYAGELGLNVQVVYFTNHNNNTIRNHERLNGLWISGARHYPVVSCFTDIRETRESEEAASKIFGRQRVLEFQVEILRRFKPRVILGHDILGEYGHGAHRLNASTLLQALKICDDPDKFPASAEKYGVCLVEKCYLHLWKNNRITVNWSELKLSAFNGRSSLDVAKESFECHHSQVISVTVSEDGRYDCRQFGLAYTTVGPDTPGVNDIFENTDLPERKTDDSVWQPVESEELLINGPYSVTSDEEFERDQPTDDDVSGSQLLFLVFSGVFVPISALIAFLTVRRKRR